MSKIPPNFFYEPKNLCAKCKYEPRVRSGAFGIEIYCPNCHRSVARKTSKAASKAWCDKNPDRVEETLFYRYAFLSKKTPVAVHRCTNCGGFPEPYELRGFIVFACSGCKKHVMRGSITGSLGEWNTANPLPETYEIV